MHARKLIAVVFITGSLLATIARGQTTNSFRPTPFTQLEAMEQSIGTVVIKSSAPIGTVTTGNNSAITVNCKMDQDGRGWRRYGLSVQLSAVSNGTLNGASTALIDYGEIDGLLQAIDQLEKIDWKVTSLSSFHASYETKDGFRVSVFSSKRSGAIEIAVSDTHACMGTILLAQDQLVQLKNLIQQGQSKLAGLMKE